MLLNAGISCPTHMINRLLVFCITTLLLASTSVRANYFDCTVVYDEFDQLMMANFLVDPERYVSGRPNAISRKEFLEYQQHIFHLRTERKGVGIAVFKTNQNIRGKLLYVWEPHARERMIPLEITESISFGRVKDGYAPVRATAIYLTPGFAVDLDAAQVVDTDDVTADLIYVFENDEYIIRAVPPAELIFPIESMCHQITE